MKLKSLIFFSFTVIVMLLATYAYADGLSKVIFVNNAWVQAMPPSQKTTAAYLVIANNSTKEVVLVSASSNIAETTEIHQMSDMNGMMKMDMVASVHIPAQGKVAFKPGSYHIMLINLKKAVHKGDIIPITLHFKNGGIVIVKAVVKLTKEDNPGKISSSMKGMKM